MKPQPKLKQAALILELFNCMTAEINSDEEFDAEGIDFFSLKIITGLELREDGLFEDGEKIANNEGDYYCVQDCYGEDCYKGTLFYPTGKDGEVVAVEFDI